MSLDGVLELIFGPLDPAPEFKYYVEIDGMAEGAFIEASGMSAKRDVVEVREGGVNNYIHKLPGRVSYGDLTLRKGVIFSTYMWDWFEKGLRTTKVERRALTIIQFSSYLGIPARWYNIEEAFPVAWEASGLRSDSSTFAVESLTLTFKTIEVEDWIPLSLAATLAT